MTASTHPSPATTRFAPVYQVLEEAIASGAFPGCAFGVLAGGEVVLQDALGSFTWDSDAARVQPDTIYDLASVTKVVATTAMAMLLTQRGQLEVDTPLGEILPGFVVGREPGSLARHVKLRHLLAHNSGLPGYVEFFRDCTTASELYRRCLSLPLEADPGARSEYSDPGFILLGKALEVLAGESLDTWCQREIFQPLGMQSTGYRPAAALWPSIPPTEEDLQFRQRRIQGEVQDENAFVLDGVAGHAGVFSNVPDLLRFSAAISGGQNAPQLFSRSVVDSFAERQAPAGSSRALGWDTPSENSSSGQFFGPGSIGHLGYSGTSIWMDRSEGVTAVLLTNRTWPDRKRLQIKQLRPMYHDAVRRCL